MLDVLEGPRLQIVDADDAVAILDESVAEVRPEEAGSAGDERGRHRRTMLAASPEDGGSLNTGFTAVTLSQVQAITSLRALVGTFGAARGRPRCDPPRRVRRPGLQTARIAAIRPPAPK